MDGQCPTCQSTEPRNRKLVADDTCHQYGGPTLWDPCDDPWHEHNGQALEKGGDN